MKNDTATGPDSIPPKFLKPIATLIAPHLTNIINCCISTKTFPTFWKNCRITPIPKLENPKNLSYYRPISILPALSKIFEKVLAQQINHHIETSNCLPSTLSGCRKGHSTTTTLLHIRDTCHKAIKSNELTILTLIDFSKAFDTVSHLKLLDTLSTFNFSNSAIELFQSYLSDRYQYIETNNTKSATLKINSGIPQGSVLAPILFNIYIASLNSSISNKGFKTVSYVDDFQIASSDTLTNFNKLKNKTSDALNYISHHAYDIDLKLNTEKTNYLLIGSKALTKKLSPEISNKITFNNPLNQQNSISIGFLNRKTYRYNF